MHAGPARLQAVVAAGQRGDIQGLRAVAVLLVISDHLWGRPAGGFVGVDIFFVLSGFLITQLLLREHARTGRISYLDFYRRRVRRIVPVASLVLVVTVAATYGLYNAGRGHQVATDAAWAFGFLANWHFAHIGTDYFLGGGPVSPLQHYWSLAVEEQFYVVWPTLLGLAAWLVGIRRAPQGKSGRRSATLAGLVVLAAVGLFAFSMQHSASDPVAAYFSTADRAWELLAGAAAAVVAPTLARLPRAVSPLLGWGGLAGIAASVLLITPEVRFPAPWAAAPVLSTVLIIAAGCGHRQRHLLPLVNPLARYVGDISYSLYLWHFPVIVLLVPALRGRGETLAELVGLGVVVGLAVFSYHLVENPIRHSGWLEPRWRRRLRAGPTDHSHRMANAWLAVGALVVAPLVFVTVHANSATTAEQVLPPAPPSSKGSDAQAVQDSYQRKRLEQALRVKSFPALVPPVDQLGVTTWMAVTSASGCLGVAPDRLAGCRFGDPTAPRTAAVLGDSYAISYMPAIRAGLGKRYRIQQLTMLECPVWDSPTNRFSGAPYPECTDYRHWTWQEVAREHPDLLVLSSAWGDVATLASRATGQAALDEVEAGLTRSLRRLVPLAGRVVILAPPPGSPDLQTCVTAFGSPDDCERDVPSTWFYVTDLEKRVAAKLGVDYVDTLDWFCVDDHCPGFVGTTPVYADGGHLTPQYSTQLAGLLGDAVLRRRR